MTRVETERRAALSRAVPYLGIACLALLALAGARTLPVEVAALATGNAGGVPSSWLAAASAPQQALGAALSSRRTVFSAASLHAPALASMSMAEDMRRPAPPATAAPPALGALALAALLVAVTLAICR